MINRSRSPDKPTQVPNCKIQECMYWYHGTIRSMVLPCPHFLIQKSYYNLPLYVKKQSKDIFIQNDVFKLGPMTLTQGYG